jgi:hypothetical protein
VSRTLKELAQEAIGIQDAVNLSGLVHAWSKAVTELREACPDLGTSSINFHAVNALWSFKVHSLAMSSYECLCDRCVARFSLAYKECKRLAGLS